MLPIELERVLDRVAWGKRFVKVKDGFGNSRYLILKSLDLRDRNWINFIYDDALNEALATGVLSDAELKKEMELRFLWGPPQEEELSRLEDNLLKLRKMADEASARDRKRMQRAIEKLEKKVQESRGDRAMKFSQSAEKYADYVRMLAIVYCMTYVDEENKLWPTWDIFMSETDEYLISNLFSEINKCKITNEREIRKMARSPHWRTLWNGGENCGSVFGKPTVYLDLEQQALVYWSQVYDSVYEAYERPSEDVINDDEKLDKWFEEQAKKNKEKQEKKKDEGPLGISKKVARHGEVFIVVDENIRPTNGPPIKAKTIEEVSKLNAPNIQMWKDRQVQKIKEKGVVTEKELRPRGDRESRGLIGATDAVLGKPYRGKNGTTRDVVDRRPGGTL